MKKILLVITKGELGGAQFFVLNLAKILKKLNYEIVVAFGDGEFLANELKNSNIPIYNFKNLKRTINIFSNLLFIFEIKKYLDKNNFNIVHFNSSNSLFGCLGAKMSKIRVKTIFTFHGLSVLDKNYKINFIFKFFYKLFFKLFLFFVDKNIFVSKNNFEDAKKINLVKNGEVIYNGIDNINFLSEEEAKKNILEKCNIKNDKYIVGSIGRLAYAKNYEFIIDIFSEILKIKEDSIFIIIGNGEEKTKYEKLIKENGLENKIFLLGNINNASKYLKGLDFFILPSRYEGLSLTLIEALNSGVPILASNVGGNNEIINMEEEIFKVNNKEDFLYKFKKLIEDENLKYKIRENNLKQSEKFKLEKMAEEYIKIYNS